MPRRVTLVGVTLVCALVTALTALGTRQPDTSRTASGVPSRGPAVSGSPAPSPSDSSSAAVAPPPGLPTTAPVLRTVLPGGGRKVFPGRILVAYYGTAGTGALGVLGEERPDRITERLRRAARPFGASGYRVQIVYELIVSIADASPGKDGDYSHHISREHVQRYIDAAHRNGALLVLDVQPGRTDFLTAARHWAWALKDPWVGLALDPEWRMGPGEVPARVIGHVTAREVNAVSAWLQGLTRSHDLPQKILMLHQFRYDMIRDIDRIVARPDLAMIQHVDGFGSRGAKLNTLHVVARPRQFTMGFKLFYDEDIRRFRAGDVLGIKPAIRFVSFQ